MGSSQRVFHQMTRLNVEFLTSWTRRLSELNLQLQQHMLSIPPTVPEHCERNVQDLSQASQSTKAMNQNQRLQVDRTLGLSQKYTEILVDALPSPKSHQVGGFHVPVLRLDSASQLLVLSGFMSLVDAYDKTLQHIRDWVQFRPKTGLCIPGDCCLMPELAIGAHRLPETSSARPLILLCLIETAVMQTHSAVSHLLMPPGDCASSRRCSIVVPSDFTASSRTGSTAIISLQAITAREEATLDHVQDIWKLAIRS
jgi:hypothetical protein